MGSSVNEFHAAKLQEEIRLACRSLEKIGYESLVVVASQDSHTEMGSERGRNFLESFDLVVEFLKYCEGAGQESHLDTPLAAVSLPPAEPRIIGELDTFEDYEFDTGFPTTGTDQDGVCDEMDTDIDGKSSVATEGIRIQKDKIVVLEQALMSNVMKKRSRNKRSSNDITDSKKITQNTTSKPKKQLEESVLNTHRNFPEIPKKTYDCDKCDKKYARFETLTYHIRSAHTGERPYKCRDCQKAFVSRSALRFHKYLHADITPFACKECGQLFKRQDYLWHHELTHSSVKKFKCNFCSRSFADPSTLRQHRMIHTDTRPHVCEQCGNAFRSPRALREHQRVHTGEKPFTCETCGESFRRKKNMVTHQRRKHEI